MVRGGSIPPTLQLLTFKNITMSRIHREILKNQLFNYDYSNTPVSKTILLDVYKNTNKITGEDITKYVIGLLEGLITQDEFEELTMLTK